MVSKEAIHTRKMVRNDGWFVIGFAIFFFYQFDQPPEKRGRKPGISLNGDKIVESMGGIVAEEPAWRGHVG